MKTRNPTDAHIKHWLETGLGQGSGNNYKPFLHVRDVNSEGYAFQLPCLLNPKRQDQHQFLSYLEASTACVFEWLGASEIKDQMVAVDSQTPSIEETIGIAESFGIAHPRVPGTRAYWPVTTDIVATFPNSKTKAIHVKPEKKLLEPRNAEKLSIEEKYWSRRAGVDFHVVHEKTIPEILRDNLFRLRPRLLHRELDHVENRVPELARLFVHKWSSSRTLQSICSDIGASSGLNNLETINCVSRAVWHGLIPVNLSLSPFHPGHRVMMK